MKDIYFCAQKPDGSVMGPLGKTFEFVKQSLIWGWIRAQQVENKISPKDDEAKAWKQILEAGYRIKKCKVKIL